MSASSQRRKPADRQITTGSKAQGHDPAFIKAEEGKRKRGDWPIPTASPNWMPEARSWFNSLALSGQSEFYEASDWATAVAAARALDIFLRTYNASIFASFVRLSERLGVTIVDRQKSRIILSEPEPQDADEDAADHAVVEWHHRLGVVRDGLQSQPGPYFRQVQRPGDIRAGAS